MGLTNDEMVRYISILDETDRMIRLCREKGYDDLLPRLYRRYETYADKLGFEYDEGVA